MTSPGSAAGPARSPVASEDVPRRHRADRSKAAARPLGPGLGGARTESRDHGRWAGDWTVRPVPGSASGKVYRCPGCQQTIPPGMPHVVVWPVDPGLTGTPGLDDRRHWHTFCWQRA